MRIFVMSAIVASFMGACLRDAAPVRAATAPPRQLSTSTVAEQSLAPIPGRGSGGAFGPSLRVLRNLPEPPQSFAALRFLRAPVPSAPIEMTSHFRPAPLQTRSFDNAGDASPVEARSVGRVPAKVSPVFGSFLTGGDVDISGATDGRYIVSPDVGTLAVYALNGALVKATSLSDLYCGGAQPLPTCANGGFAGDSRVLYDIGSRRWVASALWVYSSVAPAEDVLAVSATPDPTAAWYVYQFPACGAFDVQDGSDQPHIGFSDQWITVTSACGADPRGAGLAVFDKRALYGGRSLGLNATWFEFLDPLENAGNRDNPVSTYAPTTNHREYLTISTVSNGRAAVIYSFVEGPTNAPRYSPAFLQVTTSFPAGNLTAVDTPACQGCLVAYSNAWIHSSGVWLLRNGIPVIVSTYEIGDPRYLRSTELVALASTQTGVSRALRLAGGAAGLGPLASEIALPLVRATATNTATIGYAISGPATDPSFAYASWNIDANKVTSVSLLGQGTIAPIGYDLGRWTDFTSALTPIPYSSDLLIGGPVAIPSPNDPYRSIAWRIIGQ